MGEKNGAMGYGFSILSEDVADSDLLEDKTHERVSENLCKIINSSPKGVTVGLEGRWGSGKSTVIKLLKDKLVKISKEKSLFFMFDAWAHDGDPLRRIFLESLIREIDATESNEELKEIKERISGRKRTVEVKAKKSASRLGKYLSFSALLIPLGSAVFGKVKLDELVMPGASSAGEPYFIFCLGLMFCLAPVWVLLYWFFFGDKDKVTKKISWEFFSVDSREDYTQDITEDGERTSIEFEDNFKSIIKVALKSRLFDRFIIVIDNLDRVDPPHAKSIWSTLQTFFQKRSGVDSDVAWADKIWFVIPFDPDGFSKIWGVAQGESDVAKSFLKKCFQLIVEVPHPVMSGWAQYASSCVEGALKKWPEEDRAIVKETYIRFASRLDKSPTPRDIKIFTNQVGLMGSMWGGAVSTEAICLYVLFRDLNTTDQLRESLVAGRLPSSYQPISEARTINAELAGLLFGVGKEKGVQLLLAPEIYAAFKAGDGEALLALAKGHGDAFWIAYEASRGQWMITESHVDEYKIPFTRAFHNGLSAYKKKLYRDVDRVVKVWADSIENFNFKKTDYSESMDFVLRLCSDSVGESFIEDVNDKISKKLSDVISQIESDKFPESELERLSLMVVFLKDRGKPLKRLHYGKLTSENWIKWVNHLDIEGVEFDCVLPRQGVIADLVSQAQFNSPNVNVETVQCLIKTHEILPGSADWKTVGEKLIEWLRLPDRDKDCEDVYRLASLLISKRNDHVAIKLRQCLRSPEFWAVGQSSTAKDNPSFPLLAAIVYGDEIQDDELVSVEVKSFWSSPADAKTQGDVYEYLKGMNGLDVIWNLCRDKRNGMAIEIVRNIGRDDIFSCKNAVYYIDEFEWASEDELFEIAGKLVEQGSFSKCKEDMRLDSVTYQGVYKIFSRVKNAEVQDFIQSEVAGTKKDQWHECIKSNGPLLDLVRAKNPHFTDALSEFLVGLVSQGAGEGLDSVLLKKISFLLGMAADLDEVVLPKITNAYFSNERDPLNEDEFSVMAPFFARHLNELRERDVMLRISEWMDSTSLVRINWILESDIRSFMNPLESFLERIRLSINSRDEDVSEVARRLNTKFSLEVDVDEDELDENVDEVGAN